MTVGYPRNWLLDPTSTEVYRLQSDLSQPCGCLRTFGHTDCLRTVFGEPAVCKWTSMDEEFNRAVVLILLATLTVFGRFLGSQLDLNSQRGSRAHPSGFS